MNAQPSLFDAPVTTGTARRSDPVTSTAAARSMAGHVGAMQAEVIEALTRLGGEAICDQIIQVTGRYPNTTARRLTDLVTAGRVYDTGTTRPGRSGRQQIVWALR